MKEKLTKNYIKKQRTKLVSYQKKLEGELSLIGKKGKRGYRPSFPQYGSTEDDNILEMENFAENLSVEKKLNQLLRGTKQAIKRIDSNRYGICRQCHKPIQKGRLDIYPLAIDCISCAKKKPKGFLGRLWPFRK